MSAFVLVVFLSSLAASTADQPVVHVRALDRLSKVALDRGLEESPSFRALVDELERSDVIVHIVSTPTLPRDIVGTMRFVTSRDGWRYVRVEVAAHASPPLRVATLAHELQHAAELARSGAASHAEVRALYHAIGHGVNGARDAFETEDARRVAAQVWLELHGAAPAATTLTDQ